MSAEKPQLSIGQKAIERLQELLQDYPNVESELVDGALNIKGSPDGFDIEVSDDGHSAVIDTGVWHYHFDHPEKVAIYVLWLLSPRMKITVTLRKGIPTKSRTWRYDEKEEIWFPGPGFGLLIPIFGKKQKETLSNKIIDSKDLPPILLESELS